METYLRSMATVSGFHESPGTAVCPIEMVNWRALLLSFWPQIPEDAGRQLVTALGLITALLSLLVWSGPWDAASPRFPRQVLALLIATIVASPHSHFHGMLLLLAPVAFMAARSVGEAPYRRAWIAFLAGGYGLFFTFPPFRAPFALLLAMFAIAIVTIQSRVEGEVAPFAG
ncbi:MAG TPA: hypothetical protein VHS28_09935 [Chloroflexota bacterium]|nr:hypothetical protein [Chloroflexota bacterium]